MEGLNKLNLLHKIKGNIILKSIAENLKKKKFFEIIKYNHKLQNKFGIDINNYRKFYNEIEIEIIPIYKKELFYQRW